MLWHWMARMWRCVFSMVIVACLIWPYMNDGVFRRLRDQHVFKTARAGVNTVEWDNSAIDVDPETAYAHTVPFSV